MNNSKIALVTGASRGLGRDMAINIAKKGIDVVITYQNNHEVANEVVDTIISSPHSLQNPEKFVADVSRGTRGLCVLHSKCVTISF